MAFHQPLVPVLPVARELFSKTKLIASKNTSQNDPRSSSKKFIIRGKKNVTDATIRENHTLRRSSSNEGSHGDTLTADNDLTEMVLVGEPESAELDLIEQEDLGTKRQQRRPRLLSVFGLLGKHEARSVSLPSVSFFLSTLLSQT